MTTIICRHCYIPLVSNGKQLACHQCKSCFVEFSFFQKYIAGHYFAKFLKESRENKNLSQQNCPQCKRRMGLHFFGPLQFEACNPCQRIWLEQGELEKLKTHNKTDDTDTPLSDVIIGMDPHYESYGAGLAMVDPLTAYKFQLAEYVTNKATNKITDSSFFKKYPVLTFCLLVAAFIAYRYWTRH